MAQPDVALVYLVCALPLIGWTAGFIMRRERRTLPAIFGPFLLAVVIAMLVPWTYVRARCKHDADKLGEMLHQSRFDEARTLAHRLLALDAEAKLNGYPVSQISADIDRTVRELESRVAIGLAANASDDDRLQHARDLAMLGRSEMAIKVVEPVHDSAAGADAANLIGTIRQNQDDWPGAIASFSRARLYWQAQTASNAGNDGLEQSIAGIAYSQRKSGDYAAAEATYGELLSIAPTAATHFLLAQFYEDSQQAEKSEVHARQAIALAPREYQQQGEKLIAKLKVYHFGCLGVYRGENALTR